MEDALHMWLFSWLWAKHCVIWPLLCLISNLAELAFISSAPVIYHVLKNGTFLFSFIDTTSYLDIPSQSFWYYKMSCHFEKKKFCFGHKILPCIFLVFNSTFCFSSDKKTSFWTLSYQFLIDMKESKMKSFWTLSYQFLIG